MVVGVGDNLKIRSRVLVEYLPCGRICRVVRPAHTQVWAGRWRRVLVKSIGLVYTYVRYSVNNALPWR